MYADMIGDNKIKFYFGVFSIIKLIKMKSYYGYYKRWK